jgi:hypothetical protein
MALMELWFKPCQGISDLELPLFIAINAIISLVSRDILIKYLFMLRTESFNSFGSKACQEKLLKR